MNLTKTAINKFLAENKYKSVVDNVELITVAAVKNFLENYVKLTSETKYHYDCIPNNLSTESFLEVWKEWVDERKKMRKTLTETQAIRQLKMLEGHGEKNAIDIVSKSLTNGYQGLFYPAKEAKREQVSNKWDKILRDRNDKHGL